MVDSVSKSYLRQTAVDSVLNLLNNLPEHHKKPSDAIRMIDREIGGLLAHPESPSYHAYRVHAETLFPAGLEYTAPGMDIIQLLNSDDATVTKKGQSHKITIPRALKYPEKGVAMIIGKHRALLLFKRRGEILEKLILAEGDQVEISWRTNLAANEAAMKVLKTYTPYPFHYSGLFREPKTESVGCCARIRTFIFGC